MHLISKFLKLESTQHTMASPKEVARSRISLDKENSRNRLDDEWLWREDSFAKKPVLKSRGLDPKTFHQGSNDGNHHQRQGQAAVRELHSQAQKSLLKQEKRKVSEHAELQRSAYKQVTSLRTLPIQSQALTRFRELSKEYMHDDNDDDDDDNSESKAGEKEQNHASGDLSAAYSSSAASSSGRSADHEPKRILRDTRKSPAQSRRKAEYRQQFLQEQAQSKPLPVSHPFACPLWSMEPRIFAFEKSGAGKRKYVVGHMGRFLDKYWRKTDPHHRYYYELIREKTPCRLYLDLEFSKESNNNISADDTEGLLEELLAEINLELMDKFGLDPVPRSSVIDLDSSTSKKFSRHWIIHLPKETLFPHTAAMGYFMQELISRLSNEQATGQLTEKNHTLLHKYLFVKVSPSNVDSEKLTCFVDLGVYTRNRLFRLLGSSKFGKPPSAALRIAEANQFPFPAGFTNASFYLPAVQDRLRKHRNDDSNVDDDYDSGQDSDDLEAAIEHFKAATDWTGHAEALAETLVVPMNVPKISYPILPFDDSLLEKANKPALGGKNHHKTMTSSSLSCGQSPYPLIDCFVLETLGTRGGIQGTIRAWSIEYGADGAPLWITYQMLRNRWCECIQRQHKSNNIMWTVDLQLWHCVQTCHDPDCRAMQFRGTPVCLPEDIREQVQDAIFEEQLARLDEAELLAQFDQVSKQESSASSLSASISHSTADDSNVEKAFATLSLDENKARPSTSNTKKSIGDTPKCIVVTQDAVPFNHHRKEALDDSDDSEDEIDLVEEIKKMAQANRKKGRTNPVTGKQDARLADKKLAESKETPLSDDALLDAILSNPELFP